MEARLIGVDDPAWGELLDDSAHDAYHLPGYTRLAAWHEGGEGAAAFFQASGGGRLLVPLVIREIDGRQRDAISPYGYPGVLTDRPQDAAFVATAMERVTDMLAVEGMVSLFVRLHPLLPVEGLETIGRMLRHQTVALDLSLPPERLWSETRANHRRDINKALRKGHAFGFDTSAEALTAFERIYGDTMERLGASEYYRFGGPYFERLIETLGFGEAIHLATVRIGGEVAAAGLFTECQGIVQLHLSGADARFSAERPTKLLYHGVGQWARERADRWFHLGGGRGSAEDSLFHFKAGFSHHRATFGTLRLVLRADAYAALVAERRPDLDPGDLDGFFPAYRETVMSAGEPDGSDVREATEQGTEGSRPGR